MDRRKLVAGVGLNDSEEPVVKFHMDKGSRKLVWRCPYYSKWSNMIQRCYSDNAPKPYWFVEVCEEWLTFSNFKKWMERQDWEGKELDKDLKGNGFLYSPESCCFISQRTNTLMIESRTNNKSGIACIKRRGNLFDAFVHSVEEGKVSQKSFDKLDDAINYVTDIKINIVKSLNEPDEIKELLLKRYEKFRIFYLNDKENSLRKSEKKKPGKRVNAIPNLPTIGQEFKTNSGTIYKVVDVIDSKNITIQFSDGRRRRVSNGNIVKGKIRDFMAPTVAGVGMIGCEKIENKLLCSKWREMIRLVSKHPDKHSICEEWKNYSLFAQWAVESGLYVEGWVINKDILKGRSKEFSPSTVCFVPKEISKVVSCGECSITGRMKGIFKNNRLYHVNVIIEGKRISKYFKVLEEAEKFLKDQKRKHLKQLIEKYRDKIPAIVLGHLEKW